MKNYRWIANKVRFAAFAAVFCAGLLILTGCRQGGSSIDPFGETTPGNTAGQASKNEGNGSGNTGKMDNENTGSGTQDAIAGDYPELPDDETSNHGEHAVMETENGYYYESYGVTYSPAGYSTGFYTGLTGHRLCFYDKESGDMILLCSKPECEHNGSESCVATYRNIGVINTVLYDGGIYIYGTDTNDNLISLCLWRVGLDGSYIDKVATILEADNSARKEFKITRTNDQRFIIHRGCAYVPYYLNIGNSVKGFQGGGLMKIDLKTGAKINLYEMEKMNDPAPSDLYGCGDYVFFYQSASSGISGHKRYSVKTGEIDDGIRIQYDRFDDLGGGLSLRQTPKAYGNDRMFQLFGTDNGTDGSDYTALAYNMDSSLSNEGFSVDVTRKEAEEYLLLFYHDDKLVIVVPDRVLIYSVAADDYGKKLGEIAYEYPERKLSYHYSQYNEFYVTGDRIYRFRMIPYVDLEIDEAGYVVNAPEYPTAVYSCEINDVIAGQGEWVLAYPYLYQESWNVK